MLLIQKLVFPSPPRNDWKALLLSFRYMYDILQNTPTFGLVLNIFGRGSIADTEFSARVKALITWCVLQLNT